MQEVGSFPEGRGTLGIVARELGHAPLGVKLFLGAATTYAVSVMGWSLYTHGWRAIARVESWGAMLGAAGGILIGTAFILFMGAQEGRWYCGFRMRLRTHRMHPMLLALPALSLAGGLCGTASLVLLVPFALRQPWMWLGALPTLIVIWAAAHGTAVTTRFLYRHAEEQAELAARAREEATRAQLATLQAQLHPHFLFNALNTVASLVRTDPRRAEAAVENLAHILRRTLERSQHNVIPLADEIDYLRAYLAIEQERYGRRLSVQWDIEPPALECRVPPLTLQPLVENSLKHGLARQLDGGHVRIAARRENGTLHLRVADDGPGFPREPRDGTGLGNLRSRLATLYGDRATLRIENPIATDRNTPAGASVAVEIPATTE